MVYRTEHPKPQFMRKSWLNLNGIWEFENDSEKGVQSCGADERDIRFSAHIQVPFCPESKLSGIGNRDFMNSVWYRRSFVITKEQLAGRVILHFGAVDYEARVYINGCLCGSHKGGYVSFSFDISQYVKEGDNTVTVHALDDTKDPLIPSGKQSEKQESYGCFYTRTTGIWQTVWLEFLPQTHIVKARYYTDIENAVLTIHATLKGSGMLQARAYYEGRPVGESRIFSNGAEAILTLPLSEKHLWEVGNGRLYDLKLSYETDEVSSYFGLRSVRLEGHRFLINERSVFQRLVLDQGFYPDGIYTAPSDGELRGDIQRSMAMGFNGARLHEKIFEERFLYHCDRLGYIVWGEYPNWGLDHSRADSIYPVLPEWMEAVERDFNHPSIVGWCPFNETWDYEGRAQYDEVIGSVYRVTKAMDPTRPCIDTSGNFHVVTDVYDLHDYTQEVEAFSQHYLPLGNTNVFSFKSAYQERQQYDGKMPFFISEYGGIRWSDDAAGWGYGEGPKTEEEFMERFCGLTEALLGNKHICGLCYTQLTDVEQEQNGLYTYSRNPKFPPEKIRQILTQKAAIEE